MATARVEPTGTVGRRSLFAVFGATFFVRFAFGITLAVFASYILGRSTGLSGNDYGTVGLVSAMAPVGEFTTVLLAGAAADRVGRFHVLFAGMGGGALLFGLVALTRSTIALGALNFFFGIASGAILASSLAVIADRSPVDDRGLSMGRFDAMNLAGWLAGFAFGIGILGLVQDHRLPLSFLPDVFVVGALTLLAGLGFAAYLLRGSPKAPAVPGYPLAQIFRHAFRRSVLLVTLPWLVIYMLIGYILVFIGTAATGSGLPLTDIALGIAGGGLLLVLSQPRFGRLADRYGRMRMMTVGVIGFVGAMASASLLVAFGPEPVLLGAVAVSALAALAYGPAALAALADLAFALSRGTTMAIYSLTISLGMILGLILGTQLVDRLGNDGYYVFFGGIALGLVALTAARYLDARATAVPPATTPAR
ncbi:MAG: MFS transporter [Thermoplasmata archaeon]